MVVIIPALNEESSIGLVLADLPAVREVIVVDNGSTDRTADVARRHGATVVREPKRGYGSACLRGLRELRHQDVTVGERPEIVAFVDADYSDSPEQLPTLCAPILRNEADMVLGSRMTGDREPGAMPPQAVFGNRLACFLMRWLLGSRYTDLGPFRAIRYSALRQLNMIDTNFGWTVEMQIKAMTQRLRVLEHPVPYRARIGASKISGTISGSIKAGYKILLLVARYGIPACLARMFRKRRPRTNASGK